MFMNLNGALFAMAGLWYLITGPNAYVPSSQCNENQSLLKDTLRERIVFYNVENLFHPTDDSTTLDDDFTPEGQYYWGYQKYRKKLMLLAKVLIAVGEGQVPALIGMCEVENRRVLEDLLRYTMLHQLGYRIIHQDSPDPRGIDVALLYNPEVFEPVDYRALVIRDTEGDPLRTRHILLVSGTLHHRSLLHVFVNHWPSRRGGKMGSEPRRLMAARRLKQEVWAILDKDQDANILIMGDFNDEPPDRSLSEVLRAPCSHRQESPSPRLYNLMCTHYRQGNGTHFRQNHFTEGNVLDQMIVSEAIFLGKKGYEVSENEAHIFRNSLILDQKKGVPLRTFQGLKYLGGISDHLPVYLDINIFQQ